MHRKIMSIILLLTMGISGCTPTVPEPEEDGGVKNYNSGADAPKTVASTDITSFECEFSLVAMVLEEESELGGRVYELSAVSEGDAVKCKIKWYDRRLAKGSTNEFVSDVSFMASLQKIVSKYDFAQYNGYSSRVSGLPAMYGAKLDIRYKSDESIYAYDNQNCFISLDAIKEMVALFNMNEKE